MKKLLLCLFAAFFLTAATNAEAALMLAIEVNGVQACAADNNVACSFGTQLTDIDPTAGVMAFGNNPVSVGILDITGSVQQATLGPPSNILNTSSAQVTNTSSTATATGFFAVSSTDYVPPVNTAFASGSATWQNAVGSSILMSWYNDPTNQQGAETAGDTPGIQIFTCTDNISLVADSTACVSGPVSVTDLNPFSMTLFTQFSLVANGTVVNRGQTELKPIAVPEPLTLLLLGTGLIGVGYRWRR